MTIRQLDLLVVVFDSAKPQFFERGTDGRFRAQYPAPELEEWLKPYVESDADPPHRSLGRRSDMSALDRT